MFKISEPPLTKSPKQKILDNFQSEKDGYILFVYRLENALEIKAIKGPLWFVGLKDKIEDDDLEYALKELKKNQCDIIPKGSTQLKIMAKGLNILLDLDEETSNEKKEIYNLKIEIQQMKEEIVKVKTPVNNIVWVTVHVDNQRRAFQKGDNVVKFIVDKKNPISILLINGVVCVHGENNSETGQYWTYGGKTVAYGQTDGYCNNSGYGRSVKTMSVIQNHEIIGLQELILSWNANMVPFTLINPNKSDHPQYYENQTQSVYTVWEILQ